ncbi:hypothetical protein [Nonomuraea dietziae]|uniref:hypothetical protein n=1 Tax=Nonomuraea dietziae TaxID=65515 RepID=UPI0034475650
MSGKLVGEVVEWLLTPAADGLTTAERAALLVIAERAHEQTREMWRHRSDTISLYDRIAIAIGTPAGMKKVFRRLAERGLEIRVPIGQGRDGRPVFAANGRPMRFRLPALSETSFLPDLDIRGDERPPFTPVDNSTPGESKGGPAAPLHERRGDQQPPFVNQRGDEEPPFNAGRGDEEPPLIPYKENPYREDQHLPLEISLSGLPSGGRPYVGDARAGDAAPAAQPSAFGARSLLASIPRYRAADGWVKRNLAALAAAALEAGLGRDAILRYATHVIAEGTYKPKHHIPEFRAALDRLARDVALGDACHAHGAPDCACEQPDRPWTEQDRADFARALIHLAPTTDELSTGTDST